MNGSRIDGDEYLVTAEEIERFHHDGFVHLLDEVGADGQTKA